MSSSISRDARRLFRIMAILEMRVLDGLRAVNELAAYRPLCSWATQLVPPEIVLMPRL